MCFEQVLGEGRCMVGAAPGAGEYKAGFYLSQFTADSLNSVGIAVQLFLYNTGRLGCLGKHHGCLID